MMANEIPIISITQESDREDEMSDTESASIPNIKDACTDIEDLDSDDDITNKNLLKQKRRKSLPNKLSDAHTDVEDFDDPYSGNDSDEVESVGDKISLTEFLDQGFVDESWSHDGNDKLKHSRRNKRSSLLTAKLDDGGITDCENYETDEDDIDVVELGEKENIYDDILINADDFNTVNTLGATTVANRKNWRKSCGKNVGESDSDGEFPHSDIENIALSDVENRITKKQKHCYKMRHSKSALEAEEITLVASDNEDIPLVSERKNTCSHIDIRFQSVCCDTLRNRKTGTKKKISSNTLNIAQTDQDALTDVEDLDSSDDEKDNIRMKQKIPAAYIVDPDTANSPTDSEDFDVDEECVPCCSQDIKLPSPVREIKVIKEDENGGPISKVMPLGATSGGNFLAINEPYLDKGLTDTEDLSANDDIEEEEEEEDEEVYDYEMPPISSFDGGIISSVDGVAAPRRNKKTGIGGIEPVTDIEEIGSSNKQLRRKKTKSKPGNLLGVDDRDGASGITDTEDLYVSDDQLARLNISDRQREHLHGTCDNGGKTDVEDVSDDGNLIIENVPNEIDSNIFRQDAFFSTIISSECASANDKKENYSKISTVIKTKEISLPSSELSLTDVEDVQSENDDLLTVDQDTYSRANTATPMELRSAFNESANFSIHDRTTNAFDHSIEANHIKGYKDLQDSHTDVEILDDDKNFK